MSTTTFGEYSQAMKNAAYWTASGWSEAAARYETWVTNAEKAGVVTATDKYNKLANELGKSARTAAENAVVWEQAARDAGRTGIADIMQKYGDKFARQANDLLNASLDQRSNLNLLIAEARTATQAAENALGAGFGRAIGPAFDALQMTEGAIEYVRTGNTDQFGSACMGVLLSAGMGLFAATVFGTAPILIAVTAVAAAAALGSAMGDWGYATLRDAIDWHVSRYFARSLNWVAPKDPLVLDLDGNGITTTPINPNAPLLFDMDGDGTLTATGWIGAGEALVVRDLNANGRIDSGRELFGDSTVLTSGPRIGQKAAKRRPTALKPWPTWIPTQTASLTPQIPHSPASNSGKTPTRTASAKRASCLPLPTWAWPASA